MPGATEQAHTALPRPVLAETKCTGCGLCMTACPCGAVCLVEGRPVFRCGDYCREHPHCVALERCAWPCEDACPTGAISCPFEITP